MSIANRLTKNFKHKRKWAKKRAIDCYRLYERDIPDYPYIVDIYQDTALINLRLKEIDQEEKKQHHLQELLAALAELGFPQEKQVIKTRRIHHGHKDQYEKQATRQKESVHKKVQEGPFTFKVNLSDYLDTGLFLDHRPLREKLAHKDLQRKTALNLFSYTCSLSVALARAGAQVTSVDMSATYLNWGEENFALNDLKVYEHQFLQEDCLQYLDQQQGKAKFDIIVIDPPSFSNSKRMEETFDVQRDHPTLLAKSYKLLRPGGELYFSNNLRSFKLESELPWQNITKSSLPEDFRDSKIHHLFYLKKD